MDIRAVREALAERLTTLAGVRPLAWMPDAPPAGQSTVLVLQPGDPYVEYQGAMAKGLAFMQFRVSLYVVMIDPRSATNEIDALISAGTAEGRSIPDLLEHPNDPTFGGVCDYLVVQSVTGVTPALGADGNTRYLTADINVRVFAGRR